MSTLSDYFEARYSAQRVVEWTNPDSPNSGTKDATRLAAACTDAQGDVELFAGVEFDATIPKHLMVACRGVRAYLLLYLDQGAGEKAVSKYHEDLVDLGKVTGRDRISPLSSSLLVPTIEGARGTVRPSFDTSVFDGFNLDNPDSLGGSPLDEDF